MNQRRTLAEAPATGPVPHLEIEEWSRDYGLLAGITTRHEDFDLGLFGPGRPEAVLDNWLRFQRAFDRRFPGVAVAKQVHGNAIQFHAEAIEGRHVADGIDGHATSQPGLLLSVTVADCVPVYLAHPDSGTFSLLHAGWRGIAKGILESGIALLIQQTDATPSDIVMHCGVGICGTCYEVGHEVISALTDHETVAGHVDLRGHLVERADRLGLREITTSPWCSSHDADRFFSHRRSHGRDGRMLAFLGRPVD